MADDEIIDAEIIDAEVMDGSQRQVDGLSIAAFVAAFVVFLYPFNALVAIVLALAARTTLRRSNRAGRGFSRAALAIALAELALGVLLIIAALLAAQARATGEQQQVPEPTPSVCVQLPTNCKVLEDGKAGVRTYVSTMEHLFTGLTGS